MRVKDLAHLMLLAHERKSVIGPEGHRLPAAFVVNKPACRVHAMICAGMLIYRPRGKRELPPWQQKKGRVVDRSPARRLKADLRFINRGWSPPY